MGILDDAIRDHIELKRKHGSRESELRELQDEALGAGDRPDPFGGSGLFEDLGPGALPETSSEQVALSPQAPEPGEAPPLPGEEPTRVVGEAELETPPGPGAPPAPEAPPSPEGQPELDGAPEPPQPQRPAPPTEAQMPGAPPPAGPETPSD